MTVPEQYSLALISLIKIVIIFGAAMTTVPFMVLLERKLLGLIQQRPGPNRVGLYQILLDTPLGRRLEKVKLPLRFSLLDGHLQTIMDGIKLFLKEEIRPRAVDPVLHTLAPLLTLVPAVFVLAILPLGPVLQFDGGELKLPGLTFELPSPLLVPIGITDLDIGILFYLAVTSLGVYGIVFAGYSSNSKYSLLGGLRSSAQMLSYEITLGLSLVGVLLVGSTFELRTIIDQQSDWIWQWNVVKQPVGFLLFLIAGFAETNRLPFDLPEGESELGGGFHTEYSSMKFAMFFMSEYLAMFAFMAVLTVVFLGGFHPGFPIPLEPGTILYALFGLLVFSVKVFLLICFMIFIRGTWPRFRYDQLMNLGWKVLFPLALANMMVTAGVIAFTPDAWGERGGGILLIVALFIAGIAQLALLDVILSLRRKRVLAHVTRPA